MERRENRKGKKKLTDRGGVDDSVHAFGKAERAAGPVVNQNSFHAPAAERAEEEEERSWW